MSSAATGLKEQQAPPTISIFALAQKRRMVLALALFAVTLVFYNPIAHDGFVLLDDVPYILSNPPVRAGLSWATVKWAFTTFHAGYWHPLTWLSHALDCQIFGLNPAGHHYVSLLIHAANAVLLFLVLEEATALAWPSLLVAALFALHPVNVESVAWAAERKNVLSMFFFLLAMWAYGRYAQRGGVGRYSAVAACFVLGMMSKPQIITLPCVLLLWDYWPLHRMFAGGQKDSEFNNPRKFPARSLTFLLAEKIPLLAIAAVGSVITVKAQRFASAVRTLGEYSMRARLENAVVSYARYLASLVWPRHLAPLYPHPGDSIPLWQVWLSLALLAALSLAVWKWRERRYLTVGWLWFLGVLVPMIGIVQVGDQALADRFLYIPMIGIAISLVWSAWQTAEERNASKAWLAVPASIVVLTLGVLTYHQLGYWRDGETLWRYTLSVTQRNYMAHDNLAMVLDKQGRVEEAIPEFEAAEALHSYPVPQVLNMGIYLQRHGHPQEAIGMYEKVLQRTSDPGLRAETWSQIGATQAQMKDYNHAALSFETALQSDPKNTGALLGSALLAEARGDFAQAAARLNQAAQIAPTDVGFVLLADSLHREGREPEAQEAEAKARHISPDLSQAKKKATDSERFFAAPSD